MNDTMKAVICTHYGTPEVLKIRQVARPACRENEILIRIIASSVNSGDVRVRGLQANFLLRVAMRCIFGFRKPRKAILGTTYSGIVEAIGTTASTYKIGDRIYGVTGFKFGAHAEYMVLSDKDIFVKKPVHATFEEAAAIPFGGLTAIYFLQKTCLRSKTRANVLIYGSTGSVGSSAIQIAKYYNADVTAVCSKTGHDLAKRLGADRVIYYDGDYLKTYTETFDIIFDAAGKITKKQCAHLLKTDGQFVTVGGLDVAAERREDLEFMSMLFDTGRYQAAIDKVFSLDEVVEAHRYVDSGRKKGNVVLKITDRL